MASGGRKRRQRAAAGCEHVGPRGLASEDRRGPCEEKRREIHIYINIYIYIYIYVVVIIIIIMRRQVASTERRGDEH